MLNIPPSCFSSGNALLYSPFVKVVEYLHLQIVKSFYTFRSFYTNTLTPPPAADMITKLTFITVFDTDRIQIDNPQPKVF